MNKLIICCGFLLAITVTGVLGIECTPNTCGENADCEVIPEKAVCECKTGFIGIPPNCLEAECISSSDCDADKACINKKCKEPCDGVCGEKAGCKVVNHNPICSCPEGFLGNPFISCQPTLLPF